MEMQTNKGGRNMDISSARKTPLFDVFEKYGGKVVDYAGWALPVEFEGLIPEHEAVRNAAGLFDVSHMGEVEVKGPEAFEFVQNLVTNDVSKLEDNQILYAMMCYENGGTVDDLLVYKYADDYYFIVINAGNVDKDVEWMKKQSQGYDLELTNLSDQTAELALQGPSAQAILQKLTGKNLDELAFFYCARDVEIAGVKCLISRTGYTGEDGFEIYVEPDKAIHIWEKLFGVGASQGLKPVGLGCRDTLRFEAALPLYGNELGPDVSPLEAGLGYFVKLDTDFIGRDALAKQKEEGLRRKTVGFEMKDRGIPRHGYKVYAGENEIGHVTTGYFSPTLKKSIGLALIDAEHAHMGGTILIGIRKKKAAAEIISKRFYSKKYKK